MNTRLALVVFIAVCNAALMITGQAVDVPTKNQTRTSRGISPADPTVLNHQAVCPPTCPADCKDIQDLGYGQDGPYAVYLATDDFRPIIVQCELERNGGGWLVFQRRATGSENFQRNWTDYEDGFGDVRMPEFWLGLRDLHLLLAQKRYRLRFDLWDFAGATAYEEYRYFTISCADTKYVLGFWTAAGSSGSAGDSLSHNNNMQFSTMDQDNDVSSVHCARDYSRGAWWHGDCTNANLNGVYNNNSASSSVTNVYWNTWSSLRPLKTTEMKFRPM